MLLYQHLFFNLFSGRGETGLYYFLILVSKSFILCYIQEYWFLFTLEILYLSIIIYLEDWLIILHLSKKYIFYIISRGTDLFYSFNRNINFSFLNPGLYQSFTLNSEILHFLCYIKGHLFIFNSLFIPKFLVSCYIWGGGVWFLLEFYCCSEICCFVFYVKTGFSEILHFYVTSRGTDLYYQKH